MSKPTLYMLCGLSGSGKSLYAEQLSGRIKAVIFSSDALREELFGDINEQSRNDELFQELHRRIKSCLRSGKDAIYDATNIKLKTRIAFLNEIKNIDCDKHCHIVYRPYEECLKMNRGRDKVVPDHVITKQYMSWNTPYYFEGWDNIVLIHDKAFDPPYMHIVKKYFNFEQHNHHHKLTLGNHLQKTAAYISKKKDDPSLYRAGFLHDIGKPFTKSFTNSKGEITEEAHYYQHHCVGAYDVLGIDMYYLSPTSQKTNRIKVSALVTYHMYPYCWKYSPKMEDKYRKLWGEEFYNDILLLFEADTASH